MGNRVALLMGFVTEFDTVVGGSRMRDSNAEFKGPVPIAQEDCSEGVGGDRVAELESHSIFADVFASPRQGRLLNSELDWKVDGEPRRPIIELLHTHPLSLWIPMLHSPIAFPLKSLVIDDFPLFLLLLY
jgi:hypothetical protein